jgi:hypothetical protein
MVGWVIDVGGLRSEVGFDAWFCNQQSGDWGPWIGPEGAEVMRPAAEVLKTALRAATRGSHDSARISKIRKILDRAKREIEGLEKQP